MIKHKPKLPEAAPAKPVVLAEPVAEKPVPEPGIKRGRGRPPSERPLEHVSIRLEAEVLKKFRATGKGWQARMNEALKAAKV